MLCFFLFDTYSHVNRLPLTGHGKIFTGILPRRAVLREQSDLPTQSEFSDFRFVLSMVYFRRFQYLVQIHSVACLRTGR
jgi:hypothetical protein